MRYAVVIFFVLILTSFAGADEQFIGTGTIKIYDQLGRSVRAKSIDVVGGFNSISVDMKDERDFASALYFYEIKVEDEILTGRMTYLK